MWTKSRFVDEQKDSWREKLISSLSGAINKEKEIIRLDWSIMTMRMPERMKIFSQYNRKERISIELIDVKKIIHRILPVDSTFLGQVISTIDSRKSSWLAWADIIESCLMPSVSPCHNYFLFNPTPASFVAWFTQFISITLAKLLVVLNDEDILSVRRMFRQITSPVDADAVRKALQSLSQSSSDSTICLQSKLK